MSDFAQIPMQMVGPIKLSGCVMEGEFEVPLATYETPLWPSVNRGARVSMLAFAVEPGASKISARVEAAMIFWVFIVWLLVAWACLNCPNSELNIIATSMNGQSDVNFARHIS